MYAIKDLKDDIEEAVDVSWHNRTALSGIGLFGAGLLLGGGLALLFAPHTGQQQRRLIADGARRSGNKLSKQVSKLQD